MEGDVLKYGWLIVLTLGQIIYIWMRMAKERNNKKKDCKPENPGHGERIAKLEEAMENVKENNEKDHRLIRKDIAKLTARINGLRR